MDKVQIYYLVLCIISFFVSPLLLALGMDMAPGQEDIKQPIYWAARLALTIPVAGRIFGIW